MIRRSARDSRPIPEPEGHRDGRATPAGSSIPASSALSSKASVTRARPCPRPAPPAGRTGPAFAVEGPGGPELFAKRVRRFGRRSHPRIDVRDRASDESAAHSGETKAGSDGGAARPVRDTRQPPCPGPRPAGPSPLTPRPPGPGCSDPAPPGDVPILTLGGDADRDGSSGRSPARPDRRRDGLARGGDRGRAARSRRSRRARRSGTRWHLATFRPISPTAWRRVVPPTGPGTATRRSRGRPVGTAPEGASRRCRANAEASRLPIRSGRPAMRRRRGGRIVTIGFIRRSRPSPR